MWRHEISTSYRLLFLKGVYVVTVYVFFISGHTRRFTLPGSKTDSLCHLVRTLLTVIAVKSRADSLETDLQTHSPRKSADAR